MRYVINYQPSEQLAEAHAYDAYATAVKLKYRLLEEAELEAGKKKIQMLIADGIPIDMVLAQIMTGYGPDAIGADSEDSSTQ